MEIKISGDDIKGMKLFLATPMYGGMCGGQYTKSMCDLTAICTRYGAEIQFYALFNESLITRARNYCVDEFLRSKMDYFLFIDADIGFNPGDVITMMWLMKNNPDYDVLTAPYPKKSFPYNAKIMTDIGEKPIDWIVENQYDGKVLSIDENGNFVYKNIVNWFKENDGRKKLWSKVITHGTNRSDFIVTSDHEVLVFDDPLNPKQYLLESSKCEGKYTIDIPNKRSNALYTQEQLAVIYGVILGDGTIGKNNRMSTRHSLSQEEYADYLHNILGGKKHFISKGSGYSDNPSVSISFPGTVQIKKLREILYVDGKKTPLPLLDSLNEISLAFWYMDDGCLKKSGNNPNNNSYYFELNTQGFTDEDQISLVNMFNHRFNLFPIIDDHYTTEEGKTFKRLRFKNDDSNKFFELIHKYICPSMEYKLPPAFRGLEKHQFSGEYLDFSSSFIDEVKLVDGYDFTFDITVEDTHKVFVSGHAATQCISWEKIKAAVDKGVADENPNVLENFVGDYVFNPKSGNSFNISEPVEILEGGTGFMMMRRATFEKFMETFPQYMYRPDHVRTEAFDGSREICQFFQAEIYGPQKRYLSEDYWFSVKCQEAGMKIWLLPWMKTSHMGSMVFGGSLADLASIQVSPTADISKIKKVK